MSPAPPTSPARSADELREAMVAMLVEKDVARSPGIVAALRAVPRHLFDGVSAEVVYDPFQVALKKRGADGVTLSTMSAAHIQAIQLEQAQVRPGGRVLEIGSGGVNAAYLAELVGPSGLVVTMDIDEEVTARASRFLTDAGYRQVQVITGDAGHGAPGFAPFDTILVTVETTDVPDAWWDQLSPDGSIVAPIRWRGQRRTVALRRRSDDELMADDIAQAGFVPMQGLGEARETLHVLHDVPGQQVALRVDGSLSLDVHGLSTALLGEKAYRWTGVELHQTHWYASLDLWLATVLEDVVMMTGDPGAHEAGLIPRPSPIGWPVLISGSGMAYRTLRPVGEDQQQWEIGVIGHGPDATALAERYADAVSTWNPQTGPRLSVARGRRPVLTGVAQRSVERPTSTFTISWP